jgi:hypothetical protein
VDLPNELLANTHGLAGLERLLALLLLGESSRVRVEAELHLEVLEGVLLLDVGALANGTATDRSENLLDVAGVDDLAEVGLLHQSRGEEEVLLEGRRLSGGAVDLVKSRESRRGPDNEASKMTTRGELEKVEGVDGRGLNTGQVAESTDELLAILIGVVDNKRTTALPVAAAPKLTLTGADLPGLLDLLDVSASTNGLEQSKSSGGLSDGSAGESGRGDDEGNFRDGGDVVTTGKEKSSAGRRSEGRGGRKALLVQVDLLVPLPPDLGRSEHATGAAHVTESSLTSTVSTTTRDTRNTGDGTTGTPRLGRGLVTSLLGAGTVSYGRTRGV